MLCDYHSEGHRGKRVIVGVWDTIVHVNPAEPLVMPRSFLVAAFDAGAIEGSEHRLQIRFVDANGQQLTEEPLILPLRFIARGPDQPLRAQLALELAGLPLPGYGDYQFQLFRQVSDESTEFVGTIDFYVIQPPQIA